MKFHEPSDALGIHEAKGMHPEAFHHAETPGDGPIRHDPHDHVHGFRHQGDKVPERVMRRGRLRHLMMRLRFHGMDQIREFHRILDEEDRDVVAHQVVIPFLRVKLHGEAARIPRQITGTSGPGDGRKTHKDRGLDLRVL